MGILTLVNLLSLNAPSPIDVTLLPIVTLASGFPSNAKLPIVITLLGMVTLVNLLSINAPLPIDVTLLPIVTLASGFLSNA